MKLNPRLFKALEDRNLSKPTLAQSSTWPVIDSGANVLLIAPTGVGKTESSSNFDYNSRNLTDYVIW
jgi:ATP-dependent Lhr-like helicase